MQPRHSLSVPTPAGRDEPRSAAMRQTPGWRQFALVAVGVGSLACGYDPNDYTLSPSHVDSVLTLAVRDSTNGAPLTSLPADGFSRLTLVAIIDSQADASRRTVNFATTGGTLVGATGSGGSQSIVADAHGRASVDLVSGTLVQPVRIRAEVKDVGGVAKELNLQFTAVIPDSVLRFIALPATLEADQATTGAIAVLVSGHIPANQRAVTFSTSSGQFAQSSPVTPLADNIARIDLKGTLTPGLARIQASVSGFARDTTVTFVPALPDTILLDAGAFSLATGTETTVRARLLRTMGTVSIGTLPEFTARDAGGALVGQFRSVQPSNTQGEATAIFTPSGVTPPATITLEARVAGAPATGRATLQIIP